MKALLLGALLLLAVPTRAQSLFLFRDSWMFREALVCNTLAELRDIVTAAQRGFLFMELRLVTV